MRAMLHGTSRQSGDHIQRLSNHAVLVRFGVASLDIEARIARLATLQRAVRHPEDHAQFFAAVFGELQFELGVSEVFCADGT
eukprot:6048987-Alexandrium_andersonii.AAC.1